jgi:hypothetical protein
VTVLSLGGLIFELTCVKYGSNPNLRTLELDERPVDVLSSHPIDQQTGVFVK